MTTYNILTNGTISSKDTANDLYTEFIKFSNPKIADIVKDRMDNQVFNGKTKAINSYNSILTYVAAEAVIAAIENGDILSTSGSTPSKPTKLNPSVNTLAASGAITASGGVIGDVTGTVSSLSNHDTDSLTEGSTNLYFTNARARTAISEDSTQLNYNSSTGVLTYTQGDTDTVSEGSTNLYFTDSRANTRIGAATSIGTSASSDITIGPGSGTNISIDGTLILSGTPSSDLHAATKGYVDSVAEGLQIKSSVRVATTASAALTTDYENGDEIDGITLATGDRILIKDQTDAKENGIYTVNASSAPTRTDDFDIGSSAKGAFVFVEEGTTNADKGFVCTNNNGSDIIGTNNLEFTLFSGAGSITVSGGTGVTVATSGSSNTISIGQAVGTTDDVTFGTVTANIVSTSVNIDGGAIDGTTIGAHSAAAGTFTAINNSTAITRYDQSEKTADKTSLVETIQDLYAKITLQDQVITALLDQIDISGHLSSSNKFYIAAYQNGHKNANDTSLDYTA